MREMKNNDPNSVLRGDTLVATIKPIWRWPVAVPLCWINRQRDISLLSDADVVAPLVNYLRQSARVLSQMQLKRHLQQKGIQLPKDWRQSWFRIWCSKNRYDGHLFNPIADDGWLHWAAYLNRVNPNVNCPVCWRCFVDMGLLLSVLSTRFMHQNSYKWLKTWRQLGRAFRYTTVRAWEGWVAANWAFRRSSAGGKKEELILKRGKNHFIGFIWHGQCYLWDGIPPWH
jgi:hypothetical protein